jgi:hypothetical protein
LIDFAPNSPGGRTVKLKRTSFFLGAAMSALAFSAVNADFAQAANAGYGHLWNESPSVNVCLGTTGNAIDTTAIMVTCDAYTNAQLWTVQPIPHTSDIHLINEMGQCLGVGGSSRTNGHAVWSWTCDNGAEQEWYPATRDNGAHTMLDNINSGLCLSVAGGSLAVGASVIQWTCENTPDQQWVINSGQAW